MAVPWAAAERRVLIKKKETRKRGNCECIATWGSPTPARQSFSALIMTPCQVKSLNLSIAVLWRLCCWHITWPRDLDLDLWPLTLNICSVSPVTWWNSVPNLNAIEQSAAELLRLQCLTYDLERRVTVALGSGIIFTKFDLRQLIRAWVIVFLCCYVMSRCDLHLWPLDLALLQHLGCRVFKLCTKCERNRIIHGYKWRFSTFSPCNFRGWDILRNGSQGCVDPTSPNSAEA